MLYCSQLSKQTKGENKMETTYLVEEHTDGENRKSKVVGRFTLQPGFLLAGFDGSHIQSTQVSVIVLNEDSTAWLAGGSSIVPDVELADVVQSEHLYSGMILNALRIAGYDNGNGTSATVAV